MQNHHFHDSLLREYDIRGVVGETLGPDDAYAVGRSFGSVVAAQGGTKVAVGYDGRLSSPELEEALVSGLTASGVSVDRIGMGPTPQLYFAVHHLGVDGGVMVTGSHNPPDFNGFKLTLNGQPFFGRQIVELGDMAARGNWAQGSGTDEIVDLTGAYLDLLADAYESDHPLNVVWDCGHGAAGDVVNALVGRLPGRHQVIFGEVDGRFPAHHPDPTVPENLADLIATVRDTAADLGVGFDGDGDRIGVVDGQGRIIWGDQLIALFARDVLKTHPGAPILADVKASQVLFDDVRAHGGKPEMCKTGHSIIKARMKEVGAPLAGEMSGHIFFADKFFGHDDAIYVAVRFLELLARTGSTASDLLDSLPAVVNTPELRIECADERKFAVVDEIKNRLHREGAEFNDIDGVRVMNADGWWLLRASNTEPALVVRCESVDDAGLTRLKTTLREALALSGVDGAVLAG